MVTFAAATKPTSTIPTRAHAQRRVDHFVAITCSDPSDSCDLYSDDCRSLAELVSPSRDPAGYADGMSPYIYCSDNPISQLDPLGLCSLTPTLLNPRWLPKPNDLTLVYYKTIYFRGESDKSFFGLKSAKIREFVSDSQLVVETKSKLILVWPYAGWKRILEVKSKLQCDITCQELDGKCLAIANCNHSTKPADADSFTYLLFWTYSVATGTAYQHTAPSEIVTVSHQAFVAGSSTSNLNVTVVKDPLEVGIDLGGTADLWHDFVNGSFNWTCCEGGSVEPQGYKGIPDEIASGL